MTSPRMVRLVEVRERLMITEEMAQDFMFMRYRKRGSVYPVYAIPFEQVSEVFNGKERLDVAYISLYKFRDDFLSITFPCPVRPIRSDIVLAKLTTELLGQERERNLDMPLVKADREYKLRIDFTDLLERLRRVEVLAKARLIG